MTRSQEVRLCLTETHSPASAAQVKSQAGVPFSTGGVPLRYYRMHPANESRTVQYNYAAFLMSHCWFRFYIKFYIDKWLQGACTARNQGKHQTWVTLHGLIESVGSSYQYPTVFSLRHT